MTEGPPPLPSKAKPSGESAFMTYGRAVAILVPGLMAVVFAQLVIIPKINLFMIDVGEDIERSAYGNYLLSAARFVPDYFSYLIGGIILGFTVLELGWKSWPKWRSLATTLLVVVFNALLMFGMMSLLTAGMLLGPLVGMKKAKQKLAAPESPVSK